MSVRSTCLLLSFFVLTSLPSSALFQREVRVSSKIEQLEKNHLGVPQKPSGPIKVSIRNLEGTDPTSPLQELEIEVRSQLPLESIEYELARTNDIEVISSNLPSLDYDVYPGEKMVYQVSVQITGTNPHLIVRASSVENGVRFGNIGNFQFLDANIEGDETQNKNVFGDRKPASVGPDRSRLRLDPRTLKITR